MPTNLNGAPARDRVRRVFRRQAHLARVLLLSLFVLGSVFVLDSSCGPARRGRPSAAARKWRPS